MFGEPYAKELHKITLECNTVGTVVPDISEGFYDQLTDQFQTSHFPLQVDEATNVIKDAHFITHVRYMLEDDTEDDHFANLLMVQLHHWKRLM